MATIQENPSFLRAELARECRLRSGFALPVFVNSEIVAVLEFFSEHDDPPISSFASVLRRTFRDTGIVARMGGDEFVVLTSSSGSDSNVVLARLLQNIERDNASRSGPAALAASIGVVELRPDSSDSLEVLLARADALVYENKRSSKGKRPG